MDSRSILPVLSQYAGLLIPIIITAVIAVVGMAVSSAATAYNANVSDVHVRAVVSTVVKEAEMLLGGNNAAKKLQAVDKLSVLAPWLSRPDASRLIEAAVLDLHQFSRATAGGTAATDPALLTHETQLLPIAEPAAQKLVIEHSFTSPVAAADPLTFMSNPRTVAQPTPTITGPVDILPSDRPVEPSPV